MSSVQSADGKYLRISDFESISLASDDSFPNQYKNKMTTIET